MATPPRNPPTDKGIEQPFTVALSPQGRLHLIPVVEGQAGLPEAIRRRLEVSFRESLPRGLLLLGAEAPRAPLPPELAFWRELARRYLLRLCAQPDLESLRERVQVPARLPELEQLLRLAPPMVGAEYLNLEVLSRVWEQLEDSFRAAIQGFEGSVQEWLQRGNASWQMAGRVCFHLAENKRSVDTPFAFMATYAGQLGEQATLRNLPLSRALKEYAGVADRDNLLKLLLPVQKAAEASPWLKKLVVSGEIYHPLAFSPDDALEFLRSIPELEAAGLVVRLPDWWHSGRPARPQVSVKIGATPASGVGLSALLAFDVRMSLEDQELSPEEWSQLMESTGSLVSIRGRWVEVDRERLKAVLEHWEQVKRRVGEAGVSFLEGMRLLADPREGENLRAVEPSAESASWSRVEAGPWMREMLDALRDPQRLGAADPGDALQATLRPYQQLGLRWLWFLNRLELGACLADDMGLGKTIQIIALLLLAKAHGDSGPHLLIVPASLISNWSAELERFAPSLRFFIAHPSCQSARVLASVEEVQPERYDLILTTYGTAIRLAWLKDMTWSILVADEAQALKNPAAQQTRGVKALKARVRIALTGTPVENRLGDLWSLFDFIQPGLLGSAPEFKRFARRLEQDEGSGFAPLRALVGPYILRRLKTDRRIIADLPDKTELRAYCSLSRLQATLYQQSVEAMTEQLETLEGIQRRGIVLAFLMRFKQICNHPSQWLGDGAFDVEHSGKFKRLTELCEQIAARQEKALIFTQFQEMTGPLALQLEQTFARPGLMLHGGTPVAKRRELVEAFQHEDGPPFFVLSLRAGGTGLNLTAASHVIHFDRWWNPAVENQATDRAFRIGQRRNVLVHKFVCKGTVEDRIDALIEAKQGLSDALLGGSGEVNLTELSDEALLKLVALDLHSAELEAEA